MSKEKIVQLNQVVSCTIEQEKPIISSSREKQDIPTVLRDGRGRVVWKQPGNTPEQNEQLGIRNIQALFFGKFPEFDEQFPLDENGKVQEEKREEAREFILDKVGSSKKFIQCFTSSPLSEKGIPYFEGSLTVVVARSFEQWGIEFNTVECDKGTSRYSDENGESWVTAKFFQKALEISHDLLSRHLQNVRSKTVLAKNLGRVILYSESELIREIRYIVSLPEIDKQTGVLTDARGNTFTTIQELSNILGISYAGLKPRLENIEFTMGRDKTGRITRLYNISEIKNATTDLINLINVPQVDRQTGLYTDDNGNDWVSERWIIYRFGLSKELLSNLLRNVTTINGRSRNNLPITLCNLTEVKERVKEVFARPQVDKNNGKYVDSAGEWAPLRWFRDRLHIDDSRIFSHSSNVRQIEGRDRTRRKATLYNVSDVMKVLEPLFSKPRTQEENHEYQDDDGERWASLELLSKKFNLSTSTILRRIENGVVSKIEGRDNRGRERIFYNIADIADALKELLLSPLIDKSTGLYIDEDNNKWAISSSLHEKLGVNIKTLTKLVNGGGIRIMKGRGRDGSEVTLYNEIDVRDALVERSLSFAPEGWMTGNTLAGKLGVTWYIVKGIADRFRSDHLEWFGTYYTPRNGLREHYSPEIIEEIKKILEEKNYGNKEKSNGNQKESISPKEAREELWRFVEVVEDEI